MTVVTPSGTSAEPTQGAFYGSGELMRPRLLLFLAFQQGRMSFGDAEVTWVTEEMVDFDLYRFPG